MLLGINSGLDPAVVVSKMLDGVDLEDCPDWVAECEATLDTLDHIGPDELRISQLLDRVESERPTEIILALSADVEGEATTAYLSGVLAPSGVGVTRIAHGLPAGGGLDHADPLTLQRAFSGRGPVRG